MFEDTEREDWDPMALEGELELEALEDPEDPDDPEDAIEMDEEEEELPEELQERLAAERERLRNEYEAEFSQHKANYGRRFGTALQELRGLGFDVAEDGKVVVRDPQAAALLSQLQSAPEELPVEDEEPPDPAYDPRGYADWQMRQVHRETAAMVGPLRQELERLRGHTRQQALPVAEADAREYLAEMGFAGITDHPEFSQVFEQALQSLPVEQWNNPLAVRTAAFTLIPTLQAASGGGRSARRTPRQMTADAYRASLGQVGPGRGGVRAASQGYPADVLEAARASGMTPDEYMAYSDPDTARQFVERKRKRGGR